MSKLVRRGCKYCGDTFTARQADVDRGWAKFCSKSCKAKQQVKITGHFSNLKNHRGTRNEFGFYNEEEFCDAHLFSNED